MPNIKIETSKECRTPHTEHRLEKGTRQGSIIDHQDRISNDTNSGALETWNIFGVNDSVSMIDD
jgi:hypothetical protein